MTGMIYRRNLTIARILAGLAVLAKDERAQ